MTETSRCAGHARRRRDDDGADRHGFVVRFVARLAATH